MNKVEKEKKISETERKYSVFVRLDCGAGQVAEHEYDFPTFRKAKNFIARLRSVWSVVYPDAVMVLYEQTTITGAAADGTILLQRTTRRALPAPGVSYSALDYDKQITENFLERGKK